MFISLHLFLGVLIHGNNHKICYQVTRTFIKNGDYFAALQSYTDREAIGSVVYLTPERSKWISCHNSSNAYGLPDSSRAVVVNKWEAWELNLMCGPNATNLKAGSMAESS